MKNKLITDKMRKGYPDSDENRYTGKSLGIALETIGKALQNPSKPFQILDHYHTQEANEHLAFMIEDIIPKLDLKFLKIDNTNSKFYIRYDLLESERGFMDYLIKCDRCGKELKDGIYLGDFLTGIVSENSNIELCKECSEKIEGIIQNWWEEA